MPRPATPLLSRATVISTAVRVIDSGGLAACSLPRLARELDVRAPSLYHHFADRAEIMAEVARWIVRQTNLPPAQDPKRWIEWFIQLALNFRAAILQHPNAAPLLLEFVPRDVLAPLYDDAGQVLHAAGIPLDLHIMILDGLESITLGASLTQAMKPPEAQTLIFANIAQDEEPSLAEAANRNRWKTPERVFAEVLRNFLNGASQNAENRRHPE